MTTTDNQTPSPSSDAGILSGYLEQAEFARIHRIAPRTVARYRNRPNGLPWLAFGGKVYIPVEDAGNWLRSQVRRPNQKRRAG
jgi:hypothetical protein